MLHLLPNLLAEGLDPKAAFPPVLYDVIPTLDGLIGESERNSRRYLKLFTPDFRNIPIVLLNEHTQSVDALLTPLLKGENWGLISDCGLPCLADPGARLVNAARKKNVIIQAYPGPSSMMLALMLSGLSGQSFAFHGYMPREKEPFQQRLRYLIQTADMERQTQLFIEAPYRNNPTRDRLVEQVPKQLQILAAVDLMFETQEIINLRDKPDLHKRPAIFLIGK